MMNRNYKWPIVLAFMTWLSTILCGSQTRANERELIEKFGNGTTACILRVDTSAIDLPELFTSEESLIRANYGDLGIPLGRLQQATNSQPIYAIFDMPYSPEVGIRWYVKGDSGVTEERLVSLSNEWAVLNLSAPTLVNGWWTMTIGSSPAPSELPTILSTDLPNWDRALEANADLPIRLTLVPPDYIKRTFVDLMPKLPESLGGGSTSTYVNGLRWMSAGLSGDVSNATVVVQSSDSAAAERLVIETPQAIQSMLVSMGDGASVIKTLLLTLSNLANPIVSEDQIRISIGSANAESETNIVRLVMNSLSESVQSFAIEINRKRMKRILLGILNYESSNGALPPSATSRDESGKVRLSWRVHILPFLGESDLYREFHLDEPWDSEHNKTLIPKIPDVYSKDGIAFQNEDSLMLGYTTFAAPKSDATWCRSNKAITVSMVMDGLSNTLGLVELSPKFAVPWTSPEDYAFDPTDPAARLMFRNGKTVLALLDSSTFTLPYSTLVETWNALFTIDGRETLQLDN
jgi:hypothetical protein